MMWSTISCVIHVCFLSTGFATAGMGKSGKSKMKYGVKSGMGYGSKGMGKSSNNKGYKGMPSYKGMPAYIGMPAYKGMPAHKGMPSYKGMPAYQYMGFKMEPIKSMKKGTKMESDLSKYDKIKSCQRMDCKGKGYSKSMMGASKGKGMGKSVMGSFKGKGGKYTTKDKFYMKMSSKVYYPGDDWYDMDDYYSKGSFTGKGTGGPGGSNGDDDASNDDNYQPPTTEPTRVGNFGGPTIAPTAPTAQPTRTGGSNTAAPVGSNATSSAVPSTLAPGTTLAPDVTNVTGAPTTPSTAVPSSQGTNIVERSCETSGGIFGALDQNQLTVSYGYELETNPVAVNDMLTLIIPPLEIAFNNYLLPDLFPGSCGQATSRRRRLAVQGISTIPPDTAQYGIPCRTPKLDTSNDCVFVRGRLLLFTDELGPREEYVNSVRNGLELGMSQGVFDDTYPAIVKVTYVETGEDGLPVDFTPSEAPGGESLDPDGPRAIEGDDDNNDRNLLLPLLLAAGAVLIVVTGVVTYRNT